MNRFNMTVKEYIEKDLPFYHITPICNRESILASGLKRGVSYNAICVVRSDDEEIWYDIASTQLSDGGKYREFIVIKLLPSKHGIEPIDVAPDDVTEPTSPLHNYIVRQELQIFRDDIVKTLNTTEHNPTYINEDRIVHLTEYLRLGPPTFNRSDPNDVK